MAESVASSGPPTTLTLAALTFRRPRDLVELLPALAEQARSVGDAYDVRVVIVDNDPGASGRPAVEAFAATSAVPVTYAHEAVPNIAAARNRALAEAQTRLLVFLDDDERPSSAWLSLLLATYERERPAGVVGPVVSVFDVEPDAWVRAGAFFVRRRLPTGTRVEVAATNNLLLDLDVLDRLGLRFDPAFGLTGGEDMLLTRRLTGAGEQLVWCDEAIVTDVVPADRVSHRWVTLRALSNGNSWGLTSVALAGGRRDRALVRARLLGQGGVRLLGGAARSFGGLVLRRPADHARGLRTVMRGAGMIGGAAGWRYQEYRGS